MFNQNHRVRDILILGITAIVLAGIATALPKDQLPIAATLYLLSFYMGGLALYVFYRYHRESIIDDEYRLSQARSVTVETRIAEAMARASDKALDMMQNYMPMGEIFANELGEPIYTINLGKDPNNNLDIHIPLELAQVYFDKCTAFHTAPVGHWNEGPGRFAANQLTRWLVLHGYAHPFKGGNQSAAWISVETYRRACEWISKYGVIVKMTPENMN